MFASRTDRDKMKRETWLALDYLQKFHFSRQPLASIDADTIVRSFMEELDYNHSYYLQADFDESVGRFAESLHSAYLSRGDLYPAFQMFELFRERTRNRLHWVFERLEKPFDFSTTQTFKPDREEEPWPPSMAEADALWERRLTFEMLQEILSGSTEAEARDTLVRRYERNERYFEEMDEERVQEIFITSVANMYDPHSTFLSSDSLEEFSIAMSNALVGIGALLRDEDGICVIQELIAGGPAEMSGDLHPGDKIIAVGQEKDELVDVIDMKLRDIVKMIRGKKGTKVHLSIQPGSARDPSERRMITLIRDEIQLTENLASADVFTIPGEGGEERKIGVIDLPSFYGAGVGENAHSSTTNDVKELIEKLKAQDVEGMVLDLRRNGGGLLSEAIDLAGLFIPKGPVVQVKDTSGKVSEHWDRDPTVAWDGPLVVLTSRRSASASEIVAGALQNHRRAVIVGDNSTHGKGTVQAIYELDRSFVRNLFSKPTKLGAAKITIQKFYLPNGESTQNEGVRSDIVLPSINEFLPIGESDLPNALAWDFIEELQWNANESFLNSAALVTDPLKQTLEAASEARMTTLPEFALLKERISWFREKQEERAISLNIKERRERKAKDEAFSARIDTALEEMAETSSYQSYPVLLATSELKEEQHQEKLRTSVLPDGRPKENQYYQKVFYYQPAGDGDIRELYVERLDYTRLKRKAGEVADGLSKRVKAEVPAETVEAFFEELETADYADFDVLETLSSTFPADLTASPEFVNQMFLSIIDANPRIVKDRGQLDIPLRESIRILTDWLEYSENATREPDTMTAQFGVDDWGRAYGDTFSVSPYPALREDGN